MSCPRCRREIEADSSFCRFCGTAQATNPNNAGRARPRLRRLPEQGRVGGVCAGLAAHFGIDVTVVRLVWIALSIVPGVIVGGLVAYVVAWALLPPDESGEPRLAPAGLERSDEDRMIAGVCGGVARHLDVDVTALRIACAVLTIYPGAIIGGLVAYAIAWIVIPGASKPLQPASRPA